MTHDKQLICSRCLGRGVILDCRLTELPCPVCGGTGRELSQPAASSSKASGPNTTPRGPASGASPSAGRSILAEGQG